MRMKDAVGPQLRDQQAGFLRCYSYSDQIAKLRTINFINFEKAYDSLDRQSLCKLLRYYGVPEKITSIIRSYNSGMTDAFEINTGVRHGCALSPFLFLLAIDRVLKTSIAQKGNRIQWTSWTHLDDLDFADDLALLPHTQR